jgi:hypothetical protein
MSILGLILLIVAIGVILWLVNTYVPMDAKVKTILNVVVIIILIVILLKVSGIWGTLAGAQI